LKNKIHYLTDKELKSLENLAHSEKIYSSLKKIDKDYNDFSKFIYAYEIYVNKNLFKVHNSPNSIEDKIFESIISRLEFLNNYKKLSLKIYLESQKNSRYFLILSKSLNNYFSNYSNNLFNKSIMLSLYAVSFNIWIEDNKELDKTMSFLGNSLDYLKKIKPFLVK
jgi:hypothetical protein|tara:strand:- start:313 stop:810 length:498 start_codon:yes stop_codon:yes gene_type:complete